MPKKNSTLIDATRQQIKRILAERKKAEIRARKLRDKNQKKNELREIAMRARALKKLGLYNPKDSIKQSTITPAKKRRINKAFFDLQKHSKFVEKGRSVRPLIKVSKIGKSGKATEKYELSKYFQLTRTHKKTSAISGVIKTKKGIILEKSNINSRMRVNNKGEVVEITKNKTGPSTKTRRKGLRGKEIIKFVNDLENGKIKLKSNQLLIYHFGWAHSRATRSYDYDELDLFVSEFYRYKSIMSEKSFGSWLDLSELLIRDN